MKKVTMMGLGALAVAVLVTLTPYAMRGAGQSQVEMFEGTLVSVDSPSNTVTARSADGQAMEFHYTPDTEVVGEIQDVQGLTGRVGTPLRIAYLLQEGAAVAIRIEVSPGNTP